MTPEKREAAIKWLTDEIRSLRMAPAINGCGPENWAEQLEIMETCLEAVKGHFPTHIDREAWTAEWEEDGECNHKPYRVRDAEKWKKYK